MDGLPENCSKSIALASAAKTEGQCHSMLLTQPDTGYDRSLWGRCRRATLRFRSVLGEQTAHTGANVLSTTVILALPKKQVILPVPSVLLAAHY
jgi:hypothetical protein